MKNESGNWTWAIVGNTKKKKVQKSTETLLPVTSLLQDQRCKKKKKKDQRCTYKNLFFLNNFLKIRKPFDF